VRLPCLVLGGLKAKPVLVCSQRALDPQRRALRKTLHHGSASSSPRPRPGARSTASEVEILTANEVLTISSQTRGPPCCT
jgi:hypothetical protein